MATTNNINTNSAAVNREISKVAALKIVKDNAELSAIVTKLVKDDVKSINAPSLNNTTSNLISTLRKSSKKMLENKLNVDNISKLFPDIELSIQILISSILSPKDMINDELQLKTTSNLLPLELQSGLLNTYREYIANKYSLFDDLPVILRQTLFDTGSYITAILPEDVVDNLINMGTGETAPSFEHDIKRITHKHKGFLGGSTTGKPDTTISLESVCGSNDVSADIIKTIKSNSNGIEITDNFDILLYPTVEKARIKKKTASLLKRNISLEAKVDKVVIDNLFKSVTHKIPYVNVNKTTNEPKTSPLLIKLPSEAVIPVIAPGSPNEHLGYFVLLDNTGNPITVTSEDTSSSSQVYDYTSTTVAKNQISNIHKNLHGHLVEPKLDDNTIAIFKNTIETELKTKLKSGIYGENVALDGSDSIYRLMLTRVLELQNTKLLYIPEELVSYIAYKYYPNGTGKSIMDDLLILSSMRAILLFSKIMAATKNSIAITSVNIKLDEHDPDPEASIEKTISQIMSTRQSFLPIGVSNPVDLVDWVHRAGVEFSFEGHPGLPDVALEFDNKAMSHEVPDEDLEESIRKQMIMAMGLNPEIVDNSFSPDFAATVVSNNVLLAKRVMVIQNVFKTSISDYIYKIGSNDANILDTIRDVLTKDYSNVIKHIKKNTDINLSVTKNKEDMVNLILNEFIASIEIQFPNPDMSGLEALVDSYSMYKDALEDAIESVVSSEALPIEFAGEISDNMDVLKETIKHHYLRKWMSDNNYLPELFDIVNVNADGNPKMDLYDVVQQHISGLGNNTAKFMKELKKISDKIDKKLERLDEEEEEEEVEPDDTETADDESAPDDTETPDEDEETV